MKLIKKIALACTVLISSLSYGQSVNCADMGPICTDAGLDFTAQTGVDAASVTDPTNDYGCLFSSPNPTWYYLEISANGDLVMSLSAPSDIDYIIYGPYADLATAQADCGAMSSADIVDCSYSGTNNETPEIGANSSGGATTATIGEVYVMLITNYANNVQDITLTQTAGTGETDCNIVQPDPCVSNPGTVVRKKNGILTALPLYLCEGDVFSIESNGDYILPNDTIDAPVGDGIYTAQLMYLVYNAPPIVGNTDPTADPGFMGNNFIVPADDINGANTAADPLFQALGGVCGTYYFVPVAGDDGVGVGADDNGGLHWDKNGNGCYLLGDPVEVTFACPMDVVPAINCGGAIGNGMDVVITGGSGDYTIVNQGAGNVVNTSVLNGGTAQISGLTNNQGWEIEIEDDAGCTAEASGIFAAPTIANINFTPAASCPVGSDGDVQVTIGASGQAPFTVDMNANINVAGSPYVFAGPAGTAVTTLVTDNNGCVYDSIVTITSAGHFIDASIVSQTDEECFGDGNGSATITALPVDAAGNQDGTITGIVWTNPTGGTIPGGAGNTSQTAMAVGNWFVTITDDTGCEVTIPVVIGGPQELGISVFESSDITCFDGNDGDITLESNGGFGNTTFSWDAGNPVAPASPDATTANQLTAGTYTMTVTDENGCTADVTIELVQPDEITAWYTLKGVDCYGESTGAILIDSVTNNAGNVSYLWNLVTEPNPPVTSNIASNLPVGTYEFKVVDENFCENQYVVTITQNDSIFWDELGFDSSICRNQIPFDNGKGQVFAAAARWAPGVGGSNFTYEWTEDATGNTTTNTTWGNRNPGFYTIVATDDFGCTLTETIYLDSISPVSDFTIEYAQGEPQCVGPHIEVPDFINNSTNYAFSEDPNADTTFVWSFSVEGGDTTIYVSHDASEVVNNGYSAEGLYTVCLTVIENLNGCEDSTCQTIQIYDCPSLDVPNVFTPGSDAVNNEFFFPNVAIIEFECTVYDRWGKEVFKFNDINDTWDGTNAKNGKDCTDGVYFYVYSGESSNGTTYEGQGNVHLIRK